MHPILPQLALRQPTTDREGACEDSSKISRTVSHLVNETMNIGDREQACLILMPKF